MKKLLPFLFLFITILSYSQGFTIKNFDIKLEIKADGSYHIEETIDANFYEKRRGILRDIETSYIIQNRKINLDIVNINIAGHDYKVNKSKDKVSIRIGNPDVYITGDQTYRISYIIRKGIIGYPDHQEFHSDLIGNDILTRVDNVDFEIKLPKSITLQSEDMKVTGGPKGKNLNIVEIKQVDSRTLKGSSLRALNPKEGITAAIRLPERYLDVANNVVEYYEQEEQGAKREQHPWYLALPLALFGYFVSFWRKLRKKDYIVDETTVTPYPPSGMTSAHVGAFVDQTAHARDIVSLLPYWASEGFVEMKQIADEIFLYKIKNLNPDFPEYEHLIFNKLFEENDVSKISDLKNKFYMTLMKAQSLLTKEVKLQEYYDPNYLKLFRTWRLILFPVAMIAVGIISMIAFQLFIMGIGFIALGLFGFILPLFRLPLTEKGAQLKSEIERFKRFLKQPDKKELARLLEEDPKYFDNMFPFAVAFGLEDPFLESVEPYMQTLPFWYHNDQGMNSFSTFRSSFKPEVIQSAFSHAPTSSSGGSGGGFSSGSGSGGGGVSSW
ncbi:MAG: DUF2207 domain-containing protein [Saprospiraceae bacterium]|nr:DUF2207 domain-containing protein [Saprospiraceae bacterium]